MDPRVKIALTFLWIVFLFVAQTFCRVAVDGCGCTGGDDPLRCAGPTVFEEHEGHSVYCGADFGFKPFYGGGRTLVQLGPLAITTGGVNNAIFITVRIASLILLSSALTFTTSPTALTDALERLMKPLKVLHVQVHEIAMMMTIALRFVPTLLEETDKIMSAQKAAGRIWKVAG